MEVQYPVELSIVLGLPAFCVYAVAITARWQYRNGERTVCVYEMGDRQPI